MKKYILKEVIHLLMENPKFRRKLKTLVIIGVISFVTVAGLTVWAGISLVNYVVKTSPMDGKVSKVKEDVGRMQFKPEECKKGAQDLTSLGPWLEKNPIDNIKGLTASCIKMEKTI